MSEAAPRQLQNGDVFPSLTGSTVAHGEITLPDASPAENYTAILVYRAHW